MGCKYVHVQYVAVKDQNEYNLQNHMIIYNNHYITIFINSQYKKIIFIFYKPPPYAPEFYAY